MNSHHSKAVKAIWRQELKQRPQGTMSTDPLTCLLWLSELTILYSLTYLPRAVTTTVDWALLQQWRIKNTPERHQHTNLMKLILQMRFCLAMCVKLTTESISDSISLFYQKNKGTHCLPHSFTSPVQALYLHHSRKEEVFRIENNGSIKPGKILIPGPHKFH